MALSVTNLIIILRETTSVSNRWSSPTYSQCQDSFIYLVMSFLVPNSLQSTDQWWVKQLMIPKCRWSQQDTFDLGSDAWFRTIAKPGIKQDNVTCKVKTWWLHCPGVDGREKSKRDGILYGDAVSSVMCVWRRRTRREWCARAFPREVGLEKGFVIARYRRAEHPCFPLSKSPRGWETKAPVGSVVERNFLYASKTLNQILFKMTILLSRDEKPWWAALLYDCGAFSWLAVYTAITG